MELEQFVRDFAKAMKAADGLRPQAKSSRSGRLYQAGIGPFAEDRAVDLTVAQLLKIESEYDRIRCRVLCPGSRQRCDIVFGDPPVWAVEVKMARFTGDNGKPDDTGVKDILSPFECDRSAIVDCMKLVKSRIAPNSAVMLYGFDDPLRPLGVIVDAFEALARTRVILGPRASAPLLDLVHPVFRSGQVVGWTVGPK